jgi:SAM-dependent methyltransferase
MDYRKEPGVDIVQDLEEFPWKDLPDESVELAIASHVIEHINPAKGIFINFMNEVWRILKPDGEFAIVTPYAGSPGYWQDPSHVNGCTENTFRYFDPLDKPTGGALYRIYHPKPWAIKEGTLSLKKTGNLELVLVKRREDPSYA